MPRYCADSCMLTATICKSTKPLHCEQDQKHNQAKIHLKKSRVARAGKRIVQHFCRGVQLHVGANVLDELHKVPACTLLMSRVR